MAHDIDTKLKKGGSIKLILKGFLIGAANAVPGVSGGTIAFMLRIYEDIIDSIKAFDIQFFAYLLKFDLRKISGHVPWKFLFLLGSGAILAIVSLSRVLTWLLHNKPVLINAFFFGLICATVPIIAKVLKKWSWPKVLLILLSGTFTAYFVTLVPLETPNSFCFVFFCGFLAITSMILPGISGSFVLLLLGKYVYIMEAIINREFFILFVFASGAFIGIISFVRILSWLFHKHHDVTIAILTGFVIGSLNKIWPWKVTLEHLTSASGKIIPVKQINTLPQFTNVHDYLAVILILAGYFFALFIDSCSKTQDK